MADAHEGIVTVCQAGGQRWVEMGIYEFPPHHPEAAMMLNAFEYLAQRQCFDGEDSTSQHIPPEPGELDGSFLVRDTYVLNENGRRRVRQLHERLG